MQVKGFFASLFDYSFSSFVTPRIIKVLYALMTIVVALWALVFVLVAFRSSTGLGVLTLLLFGPIFFVISMIYVRVALELLIVFFRIHGDVDEINRRGRGDSNGAPTAPVFQAATPVPALVGPSEPVGAAPVTVSTSAPVVEEPPATRFCANCGAEQSGDKRFCTACGRTLE
jgi:uncharacterized membrane protein